MSGPRPNMSEKSLWKPAFEPDMSDSGDLTWVKPERPDMSRLAGRICPGNLSGTRVRDRTSLMDQIYCGIGPTGLTGRRDFSTLRNFGFLSSLLESLWILSTLVLSRSPYCIPLYSTMAYTQEINKTHKNKLDLANLILH
jgi:hypothetical protein